MPQRDFDTLDGADRENIAAYVPGYDWVPGRFGPPPGIPKARKDEFDNMNDKEYLYAFLKLSQEEKESLMVSEAERRRTYTAHWPIETIVKANDCAKEGFYYTGVADRVQCAFCGGIVRNWERGDVPKLQHKNFFNYCKIVQNKPCQNIPINECGLPKDLMTKQLSSNTSKDSGPTMLGELNINTVKPKDPTLSVFSKRKETYRRYPDSNPISADRLCEAGFFYGGIADKVKCFWCDGALEMWSRGDDPWVEHAKWYPGCTFLQQTKGHDFIRKARSAMTADNLSVAETLPYNRGELSFLEDQTPIEEPVIKITDREGYKFCVALGYDEKDIAEAYEANNGEEFEEASVLVQIVQDLREGIRDTLELYEKETREKMEEGEPNELQLDNDYTTTTRRINVPELIMSPSDPADQKCLDTIEAKNVYGNVRFSKKPLTWTPPLDADEESINQPQQPMEVNWKELVTKPNLTHQEKCDLVDARKCYLCKTNMISVLLLPCRCFCICDQCSLPTICPRCGKVVTWFIKPIMTM